MKQEQRMHTDSDTIVNALSVSPNEDDHGSLRAVLGVSKWVLYQANCLAAALGHLYRREIGVIICERDLEPGTWIDVLEQLRALRKPPELIVTSRVADERLWAEALNLGAYDVLAKPFDRQELTRTAHLAWLHWRNRADALAGEPIPALAGTGG